MSDAVRRHDRFFRAYFERPEVLGELLQLALPHEVSGGIDVSTLRLEPRTYLDKDHREYFADLSASVQVNGKRARVYVLFEHKSWSDAGTLLQLLRYMVQVWSRERHSDRAKRLTPVIPVVVYHGEGSTPRMSFHDLFDLGDSAEGHSRLKYIPSFEAALVDVSRMPDWQLEELSPALSAGLWSLRVARGTVEDFLEVVNRLGKRWGRILLLDPGFELLLTYMLQGSGLSPDELEEKVNKAIADSLIEEAVVTTYDQLIEKGRKEGRQQGLQEGREEARHERAVVFAEKLLGEGMSVEKVAELTELPIEEVRKIAAKRSEE